ncbi:hypothetical protein Ahia01_001210400 [Argonauta hians]
MGGYYYFSPSAYAKASLNEQKIMIGDILFLLTHTMYPDMASKITLLLLQMDNSKLLPLLENNVSLCAGIEEALVLLESRDVMESILKMCEGGVPKSWRRKASATITSSSST